MKSEATVVIGGGAMGSSVAYHLKSDPNFSGDVVVVERDPTYAQASSSLSASSIRQQFSTPLNIHLSRFGIGFLRRAKELLGVDLGLREPGYLFLASQAGEAVLPGTVGIGIVLLWIAAVLTLYTGYDYFRAGIKHVVELDG